MVTSVIYKSLPQKIEDNEPTILYSKKRPLKYPIPTENHSCRSSKKWSFINKFEHGSNIYHEDWFFDWNVSANLYLSKKNNLQCKTQRKLIALLLSILSTIKDAE